MTVFNFENIAAGPLPSAVLTQSRICPDYLKKSHLFWSLRAKSTAMPLLEALNLVYGDALRLGWQVPFKQRKGEPTQRPPRRSCGMLSQQILYISRLKSHIPTPKPETAFLINSFNPGIQRLALLLVLG